MAMLLHEAKWLARFIQLVKPWQNGFNILAFNMATGPSGCRGVFQSVAYPAQIRHLQKPYQSGETTLGTGQQSTW